MITNGVSEQSTDALDEDQGWTLVRNSSRYYCRGRSQYRNNVISNKQKRASKNTRIINSDRSRKNSRWMRNQKKSKQHKLQVTLNMAINYIPSLACIANEEIPFTVSSFVVDTRVGVNTYTWENVKCSQSLNNHAMINRAEYLEDFSLGQGFGEDDSSLVHKCYEICEDMNVPFCSLTEELKSLIRSCAVKELEVVELKKVYCQVVYNSQTVRKKASHVAELCDRYWV
jgi:hypothetical protein